MAEEYTVSDSKTGKPEHYQDQDVIETSVNTDGRNQYDWESRYPENARKEMKSEAIYIGIILFVSFVLLICIWCGLIGRIGGHIGLESKIVTSLEGIILYFFSGLMGGTIFGLKYFYRVVARGYWSQDRKYWRIFSPWISACIAFVVGCMVLSGYINAAQSPSFATEICVGFITGYFADDAVGNIRNIQIQPTNANFLRDRDVIGRIGTVAKGLGASILLEGGILSHAYYQLIRTGAKVQVRYSFEKRQQFEFNKLVRDKIPEKIEKNGEEAVTAELNKELFSSLLKRKLVEEALEVLDSKNDEDIIAELADILEVLDGILSQYQIDFNTVLSQKEIKRKKSGGFDKGIYLKKTTSRTASGEGRIIVDKAPVDTKQGISKSTDWRRYPNANESLTRIKVPVTLDKWEVRPSVKSDNIDIVLRGERKQGVWQVEISVFEEADQLSFFDK